MYLKNNSFEDIQSSLSFIPVFNKHSFSAICHIKYLFFSWVFFMRLEKLENFCPPNFFLVKVLHTFFWMGFSFLWTS